MSALGSEFKLNIHVEPLDGLHMSDYDFECELYVYTNKVVKVPKSKMKKVDEDNYLLMLTSEIGRNIGRGNVKLRFIAYIPDNDFDDGTRMEIEELCTPIVTI